MPENYYEDGIYHYVFVVICFVVIILSQEELLTSL